MDSIFIYDGVREVPGDITHVRVDPTVTIIPERAFEGRDNLHVVELPEGLTKIERQAFLRCLRLKTVIYRQH